MLDKKTIVVIGAGPAGMMAAGHAADDNINVILIEKNQTIGKKLGITGKGRCNLTNIIDIDNLIQNVPVNGNFLYSAFYSFSNTDLIEFLNKIDLETKVERGGRVFPKSDKASDVIRAFNNYLKQKNVKILNSEVKEVIVSGDEIKGVLINDEELIKADALIIATGGVSYPLTGSTGDGYKFARQLGHKIIALKPSLVPLVSDDNFIKELQGLSLKNVAISVCNSKGKKVYSDFGEMIFTHYGVSGPIILSASSHMKDIKNQHYKLIIDLKPALNFDLLDKRIQKDFLKYTRKQYINALGDLLPKKLINIIISLSQISPNTPVHQITKTQRHQLIDLIKNFTITITSFRPIKEAIITSGGVDVNEINPATMESKKVKNLYFAGELLNVDAYTGGFNLQIAFSTGYMAGVNARKKILDVK